MPVRVLVYHEEVGSQSDHGAQSELLLTVLERITLAAGGGREDFLRRLPASMVASGDMAHATHPNYPERHEPGHLIEVNAGPVLKVQPSLRYATDGRTAAAFALACQQAGVPLQRYEHRADLPCGSTIGPMTSARTGIPTVDVGAAQLAMHSERELMGADDVGSYSAALRAFLSPQSRPNVLRQCAPPRQLVGRAVRRLDAGNDRRGATQMAAAHRVETSLTCAVTRLASCGA